MKTLFRWLAGPARRRTAADGNRARRAAIPLPVDEAPAARQTIRDLRVFGLPLRIPG